MLHSLAPRIGFMGHCSVSADRWLIRIAIVLFCDNKPRLLFPQSLSNLAGGESKRIKVGMGWGVRGWTA